MINRFISTVLLVALVTGCQSLSERKQTDALQEVLRSYEAVIRWGSFEQAHQFLRPEATSAVAAPPEREMRVTHYEVIQGPSMVDSNRAIQTAVIQYVFVESQVVRETIDRQTWEFEPQEERWYLVSSLPRFE